MRALNFRLCVMALTFLSAHANCLELDFEQLTSTKGLHIWSKQDSPPHAEITNREVYYGYMTDHNGNPEQCLALAFPHADPAKRTIYYISKMWAPNATGKCNFGSKQSTSVNRSDRNRDRKAEQRIIDPFAFPTTFVASEYRGIDFNAKQAGQLDKNATVEVLEVSRRDDNLIFKFNNGKMYKVKAMSSVSPMPDQVFSPEQPTDRIVARTRCNLMVTSSPPVGVVSKTLFWTDVDLFLMGHSGRMYSSTQVLDSQGNIWYISLNSLNFSSQTTSEYVGHINYGPGGRGAVSGTTFRLPPIENHGFMVTGDIQDPPANYSLDCSPFEKAE